MNQDYLSSYRFLSKELNKACKPYVSLPIQFVLTSFFFMPLTHEEGHRSILTANGIGSISQPYFNDKGAAYVTGVTDAQLQQLRDQNLPEYIRLHTAGLESDYMLTLRAETLAAFDEEDQETLFMEYLVRKFSHISYYAMSVISVVSFDFEEEDNELERDIVGHDVHGAIRHLYRPDMDFYRYTNHSDLTKQEEKYVKRVAGLSLLNILNPMAIGKSNFSIGKNLKFSAGMGYNMAPFGDFIDEHLWLSYKNKVKTHIYFRQFANNQAWFNAGGIKIHHLPILRWLEISPSFDIWQQPSNLNFQTKNSFTGYSGSITTHLIVNPKKEIRLEKFSFDLNLRYKTKGYLPEELYMNESTSVFLGMTFWM
ncbi:MAG: hypothetical protein C0594_10510 [Marinilabiliales bacterium]|nr:MAG: hypothetical protein C0594_10510 [Marinilabiliales bacterium]